MTQPDSDRTLQILFVEDSDDDFEAAVRSFKKADVIGIDIHRAEDGQDAIDYLFQNGAYKDDEAAPRPDIILLDLNLPGKDGQSVIAETKAEASLCKIPIIVLTTSDDPRDIEKCYALGANSYVKKPVSLSGLFDAVQRLKNFWFDVAVLPKLDGARHG